MPTYSIRAPNGKTYTITGPAGASDEQVRREVLRQHPEADPASRPKSFWRGVGDELMKAGGNAIAAIEKTNPLLNLGSQALEYAGRPTASRSVDAARKQIDRQSGTQGSTAGRITGGVVGSIPTMLAPQTRIASMPRLSPLLNAVAQGALGGAILTDDRSAGGLAKSSGVGAVGGVLGQQAGQRIVAPIAERVGRTAPVRRVAEAAVAAANALGAKAKPLPLPQFTVADRALAPEAAVARRNIEDAARLGLPYSPADASPQLRRLAGSVSRFSPDAQAMAEQAFVPRAGQVRSRAINAMDEHLAPITDIAERSRQITQSARANAAPLYDEAFAQPAPVDEQLNALLQTPAGQEAYRRAQTIAANEGVEMSAPVYYHGSDADIFGPLRPGNNGLLGPAVYLTPEKQIATTYAGKKGAAGVHERSINGKLASMDEYLASFGPMPEPGPNFDVLNKARKDAAYQSLKDRGFVGVDATDANGNKSVAIYDTTALTPPGLPNYRALDYVKRGLDSVLNDSRNPLTGKLNLQGDDVGQSVNDLLQRYKARLDELNPTYRDARAAYQEGIAPRTALETGFNVLPKPGIPARDVNRALESIAPENLPEAARGYVTARADEIGRMAQGDPYKAVYGSLDEQAKMRSLFPEEGVNNFERMAALEKDMARTYTETLGGSATQPRAMADAQFGGMAPDVIAAGVDMLGGGGTASAANLARRGIASKLADRYALGIGGKKKADALAPILFNTDPKAALAALTDIARKQMEMEARKQAYARASGIFGAPAGAAIALGSR